MQHILWQDEAGSRMSMYLLAASNSEFEAATKAADATGRYAAAR